MCECTRHFLCSRCFSTWQIDFCARFVSIKLLSFPVCLCVCFLESYFANGLVYVASGY